MKRSIATVGAVLLVLGLAAGPAPAAPKTIGFEVENGTRDTVVALLAARSGTNEYGENVLGRTVLRPGQTGRATIEVDDRACEYDLTAEFREAEPIEFFGVDLCAQNGRKFVIR